MHLFQFRFQCGVPPPNNLPASIISYIIHHTSYIIHHTSYIIHHTSHTSYIIHHISHTDSHAVVCLLGPAMNRSTNCTNSQDCDCLQQILQVHYIHHTSYHTSYIIHHTSYIIHRTAYVIHHTSYVIHHTSYIQ